jgi:thiosulfate dehydrogenase
MTMLRGFAVGVLVAVLLLIGGTYFYFASGIAPAATADPAMPFEKTLAKKGLHAHIDKAVIPPPPVPADESNLVAGAKVYKEQCAMCHGLPNQPPPAIATNMYPHAPLMFKGTGVTDDPPGESFWKATNGIRLTGMPSFKDSLTNTQLWQVSQLVAHADKLPDSAKQVLVPDRPTDPWAAQLPERITPPASKK